MENPSTGTIAKGTSDRMSIYNQSVPNISYTSFRYAVQANAISAARDQVTLVTVAAPVQRVRPAKHALLGQALA